MFREKLKLVPHLPGTYQMRGENNNIIYVGKAKDLNRRVSSYFKGTVTGKTLKMVQEVKDFTYIVTNSETEAFIAEINLIKEYNPKYNILLKDDKSYPYIEYIKDPYPKLKVSRYLNIKKKDNKTLFGPYPNAYAARRIVELLNRLYPLKKCDGNPKKLCLYYHIGECLGYCEKSVDSNKLQEMENDILSFLRGNDKILKDKLLEKINMYSEAMNYEMASYLNEELKYISVVLDKQKVELHDFINRDIIGIHKLNNYICVNILFIRNNKLIGNDASIININLDGEEELLVYLLNFYKRHEVPKEILISKNIDLSLLNEIIDSNIVVPEKGIKKQLVDMSNLNAKIYIENEILKLNEAEKKTLFANEDLGKLLDIDNLHRIDAFDNSNLFGTYSVSGMVVFIDGNPKKSEYRKYKIEEDKNDDYHMMQEVIYRRYQRALVDRETLPELILVDGGVNQIHATSEILESLNLNIKVYGLKKDNHHRTNALIDGYNNVIELDRSSEVFKLLTRIQDEVHRYTITYHKTLRNKGTMGSSLTKIPGIGDKLSKELLKEFKTISNIKNASIEELAKVVGNSKANIIYNYYKDNK